VLLTCTLTKMW